MTGSIRRILRPAVESVNESSPSKPAKSTEPTGLVTDCHCEGQRMRATAAMRTVDWRGSADKRSAMQNHVSATRLYASAVLAAGVLALVAAPAHAQYRPRTLRDPATGEKFHIEADASFWTPSADMTIE